MAIFTAKFMVYSFCSGMAATCLAYGLHNGVGIPFEPSASIGASLYFVSLAAYVLISD